MRCLFRGRLNLASLVYKRKKIRNYKFPESLEIEYKKILIYNDSLFHLNWTLESGIKYFSELNP